MSAKSIITIVGVVAISAILVFVFIYFGGSRSAIESELAAVPAIDEGSTQNLSRELLSALSSLKDLSLNTDFFKDKAFVSLVDYGEALQEDEVGRENPFLPVQ